MTSDQLQALKAYIDAKAREAQHAATHGGSVSEAPAEQAWDWVELCFRPKDED